MIDVPVYLVLDPPEVYVNVDLGVLKIVQVEMSLMDYSAGRRVGVVGQQAVIGYWWSGTKAVG